MSFSFFDLIQQRNLAELLFFLNLLFPLLEGGVCNEMIKINFNHTKIYFSKVEISTFEIKNCVYTYSKTLLNKHLSIN